MKPQLIAAAELDRLETWQKYSTHMCGGCVYSCCTLPVEVKIKELIRIGIVDEFERGDPPKNIAKRLQKEGIVERYNNKSEIFTLQRMSNNDCLYLDRKTRFCTIFMTSARIRAATSRKSDRGLGIARTSPRKWCARPTSRPSTSSDLIVPTLCVGTINTQTAGIKNAPGLSTGGVFHSD